MFNLLGGKGIIRVMRQRLGQHFLINKSAIERIIAALDLRKNDTIIEIGPGEGALTLPLAEEYQKIGCKIIAIEKDKNLVQYLKEKFKDGLDKQNLEIIAGDALKVLLEISKRRTLTAKRFKVVGNIPYYITGKLLRILSELENKPELIILTVQKEVAERVAAQPPKMNLLAAATQIWAEPKIIGYLKPGDFSPPPEVESAIIKLIPNNNTLPAIARKVLLKKYYALIKILFKQPRKTILNNLSDGWSANPPADRHGLPDSETNQQIKKDEILKILRSVGLQGNERPQNLSIETIYRLAMTID